MIRGLSSIEGYEHLHAAADNSDSIILLSAHFTSLELGVRMGQLCLRALGVNHTAMYKPAHDPVINNVMRTPREAHIGGDSIAHNNPKGLLRALRRGHAVWYASDRRANAKTGLLVEFFGQPA